VIPQPYITEWSAHAPWPAESQIEQDLILSRLIVEISSDELLAGELAFRGGTCLHKLHLPRAARYSVDVTPDAHHDKNSDTRQLLTATLSNSNVWRASGSKADQVHLIQAPYRTLLLASLETQ